MHEIAWRRVRIEEVDRRRAQEFEVSSLGIGTYLGAEDDDTDAGYAEAILTALNGGINVIDTSLNYRHQRSERAVAQALSKWFDNGRSRADVVVCTKAGYLVPQAVPHSLQPSDVVGRAHSLAPQFLDDQLERSRANLGLDIIDVFYIHNPETQLPVTGDDEFYRRMRGAFEFCERAASEGRVRYYGAATWEAFRRGIESVSLRRLDAIAREIAGKDHRFRFIQLPFNLAMPEAFIKPVEGTHGVFELAVELGITVVASASILQARLSRGLPNEAKSAIPGFDTDAQRSIQFVRSCPGVTTALVGMSSAQHVRENLAVLGKPELDPAAFRRLFA
jgi:aryl-alcohol dehydrogenase-like predicted oxidoreductase